MIDLEDSPLSVKTKNNEEYHLQVAIIDHLRGRKTLSGVPFPNMFVTHLYSGRNEKEGFFLKQLGVQPGVADLMVIWQGGIGFIEVKTKTGSLSYHQKGFQAMCKSWGIKYAIVRSVGSAHAALKSWGIESRRDTVIEPDLRTKAQKIKDSLEAWKPSKV